MYLPPPSMAGAAPILEPVLVTHMTTPLAREGRGVGCQREMYHALACGLVAQGRAVGAFLPWHYSSDPYDWLVAEALLRRTTRTAARKAFLALTERCPNWRALASAAQDDLMERIAWVGLGAQRSRQLKALARAVLEQHNGEVPRSAEGLLSLPGVGLYIADAVRLHAFQQAAFPLDPNVQRVFRRVGGYPLWARGTRHVEPYRDPLTVAFAEYVTQSFPAPELCDMHRGVLHIAWTSCRPLPNCGICPLVATCQYAARSAAGLRHPNGNN